MSDGLSGAATAGGRRIAGSGNARRIRTAILVGLGALLLLLGLTGRLGVSADIEIEADEAIEIARAQPQLDFVPVDEGARLVRQGVGLQPVWAVSFSIPGDGGRDDFERHMTVEIDATNGEVKRIGLDNANG